MQKLPGSPELVETESVLEKRSVVVEKRDLQEKSTTCLSNEKKSVKMIMENMMKSSSSRGERTWMVEVNDEVVYSFSVQDESICMDKVREQVLRGLGENAKVPDGFAIRTGLNKVTPVESDDTLREVIAGLPNFTVIVPVYTAETTQAQQQLEDEAELVSKVAAFDLDEEMSSSSCSDDEDEEDEIANDDDDDDDDDDDEDCEDQEENRVDASEIEFEDERAKSIIAALAERDSSVNVEETLAKFESIFPDSATKVGFLLFASNQKEKRLAKIGLDVAAAKKVSRDEALAFEYEILAKLSPTEVAIALLNYRIKPGKLLKSGLGRLGYTMKLAKKAFKGGPYGVKAHKKMMKKAHKAHKKMKGGKHMRPDHPWAHGPGGHHGHHHGRHGLGGGFRGGRHGGFGGHVPFEGPEGAPRHRGPHHGGPHHGGPHHGGPHHGGPHHGGPHHGGPHHGGPHHGGPHHGGPRHGGPHHGGRMHFGGGPHGMMGHPGCPPPPPFEHQHSEARMPVDSEVHGGPAAGFGGWAPHMGRGGRGGRGRAGFGGRGGHMFHPGFMAGPFAPPPPKNHNGESSSDDEGENEKFSGAGHFGLPGHWGSMMWHGGHHGHHGRGPRHAHHGGLGFGGGPGRCHMRGMRNHPGCMKKLARFVAHKSIPDGMKIRGLTTFEKKWRIRNDSEVAWAGPASLVNARGGDNLSMKDTKSTLVGPLQPGEEIEVEIGPLQAPEKPGLYKAFFRLQGDDGRFGQRLWCEIFVPESNEDVLAIATEEAKEQ